MVSTRILCLAVALLMSPSLGGCFAQYGNACVDHSHCPVPEQCSNGICLNPEDPLVSDSFTACSTGEECQSGSCYEGYCEIFQVGGDGDGGGDCFGDHSACEGSYCGFDWKCVPADPDVNVTVGTGGDSEIALVSMEDVDSLDGVNVIAGSLYIGKDYNENNFGSLDTETLVLDDLEIITGNLVVVGQLDIRELRFPNLERIGGNVYLGESGSENDIRVIDLPALAKAGGDGQLDVSQFYITDNRLLSEVNMPLLERVFLLSITAADPEGNGDEQPEPLQLDLGSLTSADFLFLDGNGAPIDEVQLSVPAELEQLSLHSMTYDVGPVVESVTTISDSLTLSAIEGTDTLDLANLESVSTELTIDQTSATSISAPNLTEVGEKLTIESNEQLTDIDLPSLTTAPDLRIANNPMLDVCQAVEVKDQVDIPSANANLSGNMGDPDSCP